MQEAGGPTGTLTRRGVELDVGAAQLVRIERALTVAPRAFSTLPTKKIRMFERRGGGGGSGILAVPRFWARDRFQFRIPDREPHRMPHAFGGTLLDALHQPAAAAKVLDSLRATGGAVLSLPCGHGKTATALYVAAALGVKTLVLVHKTFLADQFEKSVRRFVPGATVSRIEGSKVDVSGDFVLCTLQTIAAKRAAGGAAAFECFDSFGLAIVDKCHHVPAESFSRAMFETSFRYVLGLSATPERKDGLTDVVHWFLGPLAFRLERRNQGHVTVQIVRFDHAAFTSLNCRGDVDHARLINLLCDLGERTALVVEHARALAVAGRHVLVLSHRRRHATRIRDALVDTGVDAQTYLGGQKDAPTAAAVVVCATYSLVSEGYDDPRMSVLVLATPASDVVQSCGRILRSTSAPGPGPEPGPEPGPVIVDVVDRFSTCFAQSVKRTQYYRRAGFVVVETNGDGDGDGVTAPPDVAGLLDFVNDDHE